MTTERSTPGSARQSTGPIRLRTPEQSTVLPDWMRDPPPPRRTLGVRLAEWVGALPGGERLRHRWWAWQRRGRLYQRYPNTVKIVAMVLSWAAIMLLVSAAYALYGQA